MSENERIIIVARSRVLDGIACEVGIFDLIKNIEKSEKFTMPVSNILPGILTNMNKCLSLFFFLFSLFSTLLRSSKSSF